MSPWLARPISLSQFYPCVLADSLAKRTRAESIRRVHAVPSPAIDYWRLFRLNVVPVHLPPLRERPEDIEPLLGHFLARSNERLGKEVSGFTSEALDALRSYSWPGNIRELENLVERMVLFASGDNIGVENSLLLT